MFEDSETPNISEPKLLVKKKRLFALLLLVIAVICLLVSTKLLLERYFSTNGTAALPQSNKTITEDDPTPSEVKVSDNDADNYTVPADLPRSISLPSIDTKGLVQRVGLNKDNHIAVPSNIHFAGWFTENVKPGDVGLSIIDGHVSGRYVDAIFKRLKDLKKGDKIAVEFGDRSVKNFEVVDSKTLPENKAAAALFDKRSDIKQQLNLITCGGKFNSDNQTFADRVVVITKLVE